MIDTSVLQGFSFWVANNWAASAIIGGLTWDIAKKYILNPLKNKISKYFVNEYQAQNYIEALCIRKLVNPKKPYRDIEDLYEEIAGKDFPDELLEELKRFMIENRSIVDEMNKEIAAVFQIKEQLAGRDINNVNGSQIIINK
ncbi:MAG: hypothetical protein PWQ59_1309 [Thermoanaerobacterium sp.]|nr:hypothetical protein [Thermoanaerobacterium sp.]MDK2801138.1 hypothetical protein [Clostridiales bacterium]